MCKFLSDEFGSTRILLCIFFSLACVDINWIDDFLKLDKKRKQQNRMELSYPSLRVGQINKNMSSFHSCRFHLNGTADVCSAGCLVKACYYHYILQVSSASLSLLRSQVKRAHEKERDSLAQGTRFRLLTAAAKEQSQWRQTQVTGSLIHLWRQWRHLWRAH